MLPASCRRNPAPKTFLMKIRDQRQEQLCDFGPLFTGEVLRDEGIKKVADNNERWMDLCVKAIEKSYSENWTFTGEDMRHLCETTVGCPAHSNAWGALVNTLVRRKIIKPTGEYRAMRDDNSHARKTPVYRK
jgi:hypothetical protein